MATRHHRFNFSLEKRFRSFRERGKEIDNVHWLCGHAAKPVYFNRIGQALTLNFMGHGDIQVN
ncbi:MAG: hypothetical protein QNL51_03820 [Opitutaceae bacterium]